MSFRIVVVLAYLAFLPVNLFASDPPESTSGVKIALLKSMVRDVSPQKFDAMAANFKSVVREQSGFDGELVVVPTVADLCQQMQKGDVQLGAFHGFEFAWMKQKHPELEAFLLAGTEPEARRSVVVVGKANPAKSMVDLRGHKLNMTLSTPEHSRLFLDRLCLRERIALKDLFAKVETPKTVEESLDEVVDGKVQVAVVEQSGLKMFERRKPARFARLRVLEESTSFPPNVLAYMRGKVGDSTLKSFRDGMNSTDKTEQGKHLMTQMKIKRFEAIPADFDKQLEAIAKVYPASGA